MRVPARLEPLWTETNPSLVRGADQLRSVLSVVTGQGWAVAGSGALAGLAGAWLGWQEASALGAACGFALAVAVLFTLGARGLTAEVDLSSRRVTVGDPVRLRVLVTNARAVRSRAVDVEIPLGDLPVVRRRVPALDARGSLVVEVPAGDASLTARRGVVVVGPVWSVRDDPLGLLRRAGRAGEPTELFVHPRTVPVGGLGTGLLRDMEGRESTVATSGDLAFHALRPYSFGDDLRHVHWLAVARSTTSDLVVRQFVDTRTSQVVVGVSNAAADYADEEQFELAMSVAASVGVRSAHDDRNLSLLAGDQFVPGADATRFLDGLSRVRYDRPARDVTEIGARSARAVPEASLAVFVAGPALDAGRLRAAARRFHPHVRVVGVRVAPGAPASGRKVDRLVLITVPGLAELASALRGVFG